MKCLFKFKWVKLPRNVIPAGKGIMGYWMKLASRAAFRKGNGVYCGYENAVTPGMWVGGVVGLKSILGVRRRPQAMYVLSRLEDLEYLSYNRDPKTKKLTYELKDWIIKCSGKECTSGTVYATDGYGFLCIPRNITERLVEKGHVFEETDAWLDLWCHTVFRDYGNVFSFLAPAVQYGKYGSVLTLDSLGKRWGWEKTKVWRFFRKFGDDFALYRLSSACGCVIYNLNYPSETEYTRPNAEHVKHIMELIRITARKTYYEGSENTKINRIIAWKSRKIIRKLRDQYGQNEYEEAMPVSNESEARVAVLATITRAYFSHGRNCKYGRKCIYDCSSGYIGQSMNLLQPDMGAVRLFGGEAHLILDTS